MEKLVVSFRENRLNDIVKMAVNNETVQKVTGCKYEGCITAKTEYDIDMDNDFLIEIYESNPYNKNSHIMVWVQTEKTKSFCTISHLKSKPSVLDFCFVKHASLMPSNEGKTLVGVHWNSHRNCWSVVNMKSRKTVGLLNTHMQTLVLSDISFKVDLSKKRKALEIGKKDRHTFIVGYLENETFDTFDLSKIDYNVKDNNEPFNLDGQSILGENVYFENNGKVYLIN